MSFKFLNTKLSGLILIERQKYFDKRGYLTEIMNSQSFFKNKVRFKNALISKSNKNVLRGFHYQKQKPISQFVTCIKGEILDVAVDIRKSSKTFGQYEYVILSEKNNLSFFMSEGFAHAFLTLKSNSLILYNNSQDYIKEFDSGFVWNDSFVNFKWPIKNPILSERDKNFKDFISEFNL
jgi:dTDP-4-dehydrorhamnose 3,5-epimerase